MEKTPLSMRKHIAIFGLTNAGKSSLFNGLLGQEVSIVSEVSGTTTDPVVKAMELTPYGPVALIDTAGLGDETVLGEKRMKKTREILNRTDLVILVKDITSVAESNIDFGKLPVVTVYTKCDIAGRAAVEAVDDPNAVFIYEYTEKGLKKLRDRLVTELKKQERDDEAMLGGIVAEGDTVVFVIPIDEAAPKGRLILPQVQAIRECLDNGVCAVCVTPEHLCRTLEELPCVKLVVTDSQLFEYVGKAVPSDISLTSFSMLLANQKGRIRQLIDGTKVIKDLKDGDKILMLEACTHTTAHNDIGKVKIPGLLRKKTGKQLEFTHLSGRDFPENFEQYKLIIQCGGCMINKKEIITRLELFEEKGVCVTNYGVALAYLSGTLERAAEVFLDNQARLL